MRTCEDGRNGCDECTDYADEADGPPEFGCCLPDGECCMPGLHFPSECHTAADYERQHGTDWREPPNAGANRPWPIGATMNEEPAGQGPAEPTVRPLVERLQDEADLCRNDGANDIADLLDEATEALNYYERTRR